MMTEMIYVTDRLTRMTENVGAWLVSRKVIPPTRFWLPSDWHAKGRGEWPESAAAVLDTDPVKLKSRLSIMGVDDVFDDYAKVFGYEPQGGQAGKFSVVCFLPLKIFDDSPPVGASYREVLDSDSRWVFRRDKIKARQNGACRKCGKIANPFEVHHEKGYRLVLPWEYPLDELVGLCNPCHHEEHRK